MFNLRDAHIMAAIPEGARTIVNVGCGAGRVDKVLFRLGYQVTATDVEKHPSFPSLVSFFQADILDRSTFRGERYDVVICSEVLEHLEGWRCALSNLCALTKQRLIITVPWRNSFDDKAPPPQGHCNYWDDEPSDHYMSIREFVDICDPFETEIYKALSKPRDLDLMQKTYIITATAP